MFKIKEMKIKKVSIDKEQLNLKMKKEKSIVLFILAVLIIAALFIIGGLVYRIVPKIFSDILVVALIYILFDNLIREIKEN